MSLMRHPKMIAVSVLIALAVAVLIFWGQGLQLLHMLYRKEVPPLLWSKPELDALFAVSDADRRDNGVARLGADYEARKAAYGDMPSVDASIAFALSRRDLFDTVCDDLRADRDLAAAVAASEASPYWAYLEALRSPRFFREAKRDFTTPDRGIYEVDLLTLHRLAEVDVLNRICDGNFASAARLLADLAAADGDYARSNTLLARMTGLASLNADFALTRLLDYRAGASRVDRFSEDADFRRLKSAWTALDREALTLRPALQAEYASQVRFIEAMAPHAEVGFDLGDTLGRLNAYYAELAGTIDRARGNAPSPERLTAADAGIWDRLYNPAGKRILALMTVDVRGLIEDYEAEKHELTRAIDAWLSAGTVLPETAPEETPARDVDESAAPAPTDPVLLRLKTGDGQSVEIRESDLSGMTVMPFVIADGKIPALKLLSVPEGSAFWRLGLREGDLLSKTNGRPLSLGNGFEAFFGKPGDGKLRIEIERDRKTLNFNYAIEYNGLNPLP